MTKLQDTLLLTLCIPTRNRYDVLEKTLTTIYSSTADCSMFEVVIYDSSDEKNEAFYRKYHNKNLSVTFGENHGYLNLIEALKLGNGVLLKLHNDYSSLQPNTISEILTLIQAEQNKKPQIFFLNGSGVSAEKTRLYNSDDFIKYISYYSSWSTSLAIWKSDFCNSKPSYVEPMFPHCSYLFDIISNKTEYLIDNTNYFQNLNVKNKGGYDLFHTFGVVYLNMIRHLVEKKIISPSTLKQIKSDMKHSFFSEWYYLTVLRGQFSFQSKYVRRSLLTHYSLVDYVSIVSTAKLRYTRAFLATWKKKVVKKISKWISAKPPLNPLLKVIKSDELKRRFHRIGTNVSIPELSIIHNPQYMSIGDNFAAMYNLRLECWDYFEENKFSPQITIGNDVRFNTDVHIGCIDRVSIGNGVLLASRIYICDHSHGDISRDSLKLPPAKRPLVSKGPIVIEDNVWLGEGVCVLPNVVIGANSIVGANAVVTKSCPPNSVLAGAPARIIKSL